MAHQHLVDALGDPVVVFERYVVTDSVGALHELDPELGARAVLQQARHGALQIGQALLDLVEVQGHRSPHSGSQGHRPAVGWPEGDVWRPEF